MTMTIIAKGIQNGLTEDLKDIKVNLNGHLDGIKACHYFNEFAQGKEVTNDSMVQYYFDLTRDFVTVQNKSGYESLKSQGLDLIKDDELRFEIISLYEYDFAVNEKLEEGYDALQFNKNHFKEINQIIAPYFVFDSLGRITKIESPVKLTKSEKQTLLSALWKIRQNRGFMIAVYGASIKQIEIVNEMIDEDLE